MQLTFLVISRVFRAVFIHVYSESFSILARFYNFPTVVVLASALCWPPLIPSYSLHDRGTLVTHAAPPTPLTLVRLASVKARRRDLAIVGFFVLVRGVIWKMAPVVTG